MLLLNYLSAEAEEHGVLCCKYYIAQKINIKENYSTRRIMSEMFECFFDHGKDSKEVLR